MNDHALIARMRQFYDTAIGTHPDEPEYDNAWDGLMAECEGNMPRILALAEQALSAVLIGRPAEYRGTTLQAIKDGTPLSRGRITTVWPDGRIEVAMENGSTITGPRDQFIVAAASEDSHE